MRGSTDGGRTRRRIELSIGVGSSHAEAKRVERRVGEALLASGEGGEENAEGGGEEFEGIVVLGV